MGTAELPTPFGAFVPDPNRASRSLSNFSLSFRSIYKIFRFANDSKNLL